MTAELQAALQSLTPGDLVTLYHLDLTPIGQATHYYFSPTNDDGTDIVFNSQAYSYAGVDITGVEWSAEGTPPSPKLYLPNAEKFAAALVVANDDLVGAKITRTRTFRQFLDGESMADTAAVLSQETFTVEQKANMNKTFVEFVLRPIYDVGKRKLPGRLCLKSICMARYRDGSSGTFDYSGATCPYVGASMFDRDGNTVVDEEDDDCSKDVAGCKLRYGTNPLPIWAFPGMGRIRI